MNKDLPIAPKATSIGDAGRALEQMVYHAVMEFSPWPMAEVEGDTHVVRAINPAFCALLERAQEDVLGKPLAGLFSDKHATHGLLDRVRRTGEAATHVEAWNDTPGAVYWSYTCWPVQAADDRHVGLMIQVTETTALDRQTKAMNEALLISAVEQHELTDVADRLNVRLHDEIAERQKAEEAVRTSDEQLRQALDAGELGTWNMDPGTGQFSVDARYETIFGAAGSKLALEQGMAAVHPDDRGRLAQAVEEAMRSGANAPIEIEYRVLHPDGSLHWVLSKGRMTFQHDGPVPKLTGFAGTVADITERKQMELALQQTAKDLAEVDRRKSEFLATLAHELRNPLAPLRNGLELLSLADHDQVTWDQAHGMMRRQLDQMVRLIDELMDLSRITRGVVELRKETVDLRGILDQTVEAGRALIERQDHTLVLDLPDHAVLVDGDAMRLTQVFSNLLNNAAKYTDRSGSIAVRLDSDRTHARITVEDNGIGIAADQLEKVFDMFAQVERTSDRVQGGLGIGLNIVRHLVGMHGGRIQVRSDGLGKGSGFTVMLPLALRKKDRVSPPPPTVVKELVTPRRILIVDDNEDAATMMALLLTKAGHDVRVAHNGEQALEAGGTLLPQVVLMDLGMPVMDGCTACRHMRGTPWGARALIVALSGWGQEEDREKSRAAGFDHHLVKPIPSEEVFRLVATAAVTPSVPSTPAGPHSV